MFCFQAFEEKGTLAQSLKNDVQLKGILANAKAALPLSQEERTYLNNLQKELSAAVGDAAALQNALKAICNSAASDQATKEAAALLFGFGFNTKECIRLEYKGKVRTSVLDNRLLKSEILSDIPNEELAKIAYSVAQEQFLPGPVVAGVQTSPISNSLEPNVPYNTSLGPTKVYFDYIPQTISPPGIRVTLASTPNMDFSWGLPGSGAFKEIYNFYLNNFSTTNLTEEQINALKPAYSGLVDTWLAAKFDQNGTQTVYQVLSAQIKPPHTIDEFIKLFKNFQSRQAFSLLDENGSFYFKFGLGKMEYKDITTYVVQSQFAKRASNKLSAHTGVTVPIGKNFSIVGYFDYNNVHVKAQEESPSMKINFFDAGGMLIFHMKHLYVGGGGGYQWGDKKEGSLDVPLNALYYRLEGGGAIPLPRLFQAGLSGTFTQSFFEGGNAFMSARLGAKLSKSIELGTSKNVKPQLDIYVNPFADFEKDKNFSATNFTVRTGIDLKKLPMPGGFVTLGGYYDYSPTMGKGNFGIQVHYHW